MRMTLNPSLRFMKLWLAGPRSLLGLSRLEDLPQAARDYVSRIEVLIGAPVDVVSTGPDRVETIVLRHAFG